MRDRILSAVAAGAASGGVAVGVLAVTLLAGVEESVSLLVLGVGVGLVLVAHLIVALVAVDTVGWRAGAVSAAVAGGLSTLLPLAAGIGVLQWSVMAGGAALAIIGPRALPLTAPGRPTSWAVLGLAVVAIVLVRVVVEGGSLGHDESALALKARAWVEGTPDTGWSIHRGVGMSAVAALILPITQSESVLRLVSVALSLGTVAAVWWLGRSMRSNRVGLAAAAAFAIAPSFLRRGSEFLTDVPSTGLLLAATALLWSWLADDGAPPRRLLWAVVLGAAAVYVRYQAVLSLGLVAVATVVCFPRRLQRSLTTVLAALVTGVLALVPHMVWATGVTGTPWGVFLFTGEAGGREFLGQGLVDYAIAFPYLLAGPLGAAAIIVALGWSVYRLRGPASSRIMALFLVIPALGQLAALGLISHGEPRFVFFPVALLLVAAALALDDLRRRTAQEVWRAVTATLVVALVVAGAEAGARADRNAEARAAGYEVIVESSTTAASAGDVCAIMTGYLPQTTWETGCASHPYALDRVEVPPPVRAGGTMIFYPEGIRQPEGAVRDAYVEAAGSAPIVVDDRAGALGDGSIYVFSP